MPAGRKRMPSALNKLHGNPSGRPINEDEPVPDVCIPSPPRHLNKLAVEEWNRITPILENLGLISNPDRAALAAYCQAYARWARAETVVEAEGIIFVAKNGYKSPHPAVGIANVAMDKMHKFLIEFGLTPSSRAKLSGSPAKRKDKMDEFNNKPKNSPVPKNIKKFTETG